jgi:hypothetical protein
MVRHRLTPAAQDGLNHSTHPRRSSISADVTTTALINPRASTRICRWRPVILWWPSTSMSSRGVAVLRRGESTLPAEGAGCRLRSRRAPWRRASIPRAQTPSRRQRLPAPSMGLQWPQAVGPRRQWPPVWLRSGGRGADVARRLAAVRVRRGPRCVQAVGGGVTPLGHRSTRWESQRPGAWCILPQLLMTGVGVCYHEPYWASPAADL